MPIAAGRPLDARTRMALERTRLARERAFTLWVIAAALVIALGFALATLHVWPRLVAIATIGMGLFSVCVSTITYRRRMKELPVAMAAPRPSTTLRVAVLVFGLGTLALVAALLFA